MEFLAKELTIEDKFNKPAPKMYLCVHAETEILNEMESSYPIQGYDCFMSFKGKEYRVLCEISEKANTYDDEILDADKLRWCDPKALVGMWAKCEYFPLEDYLYSKRPAWIMSKIFIKRIVERIL